MNTSSISARVSSEPFYTCHPSMREGAIDDFWRRPTHVAGGVHLGSLRTLEGSNAGELAAQGFTRVILLCDADAVSVKTGEVLNGEKGERGGAQCAC